MIGFIGLADQDFESEFNPSTDIGWRLKRKAWGMGYATEGARRCLKYAFDDLNIDRITSTCTIQNKQSEHIMKKIGMTKKGIYKHPKLSNYSELETCVWYEIKK